MTLGNVPAAKNINIYNDVSSRSTPQVFSLAAGFVAGSGNVLLAFNHSSAHSRLTNANVTASGDVNVMTQAALISIMVLTLLLYSRYTRRSLIKPIETLNREANSILAHVASREPYISSIHTGDEIEALSKSFENMSRDMIDYIDQNARMSADKQRLITEVDMAASIQASQLPGVFPPLTDRREFDIFASMKPARMVGGDFYDFFIVKLKNPKRAAAFIAIWVATVAVVAYAYPRIEVFATSWNNYLLP